jgi:alcohol dehydrogenase (cytochrome c)
VNSRSDRSNARGAHMKSRLLGVVLFAAGLAQAAPLEWPTFNRTLTSERFVPLQEINAQTVDGLKVLCTYDTHEKTAFQTGLLQVNGALYWTTEHDTFAVDPNTCQEKWRAHEEFPSAFLSVSRGAAYLEGRLFRGTNAGQVIAYDANTGQRVWSTTIADPKRGELVSASPIAWNGIVFIGTSAGDVKGVKGRMYALEAASGRVLWEFFLVPKQSDDRSFGPAAPGPGAAPLNSWENDPQFPISGGGTWTSFSLDPKTGLLYVPGGNPSPDFVGDFRKGPNLYTGSVVVLDARTGKYRRHFQLVVHDFHDWDVSGPPALFGDRGGHPIMAVAPKDGYLYVIDLKSGKKRFQVPMTTMANGDTPLTPEGVHFCPGTQGGAEWNGPAYNPQNNTIVVGEVDWCTTVHTDPKATVQGVSLALPWTGSSRDGFGRPDDKSQWAGWVTAVDVTSGTRKWQFKAPNPILGAVTPTAGHLVFVGDMGNNLYALDADSGAKLWSSDLGGAVAGGLISYDTGVGQRVAVAVGMTSPIWPTAKVTAKVVILGRP